MPPKNRRGGLRSNPLDAVIPDPAAVPSTAQAAPEPVEAEAPTTADPAPGQIVMDESHDLRPTPEAIQHVETAIRAGRASTPEEAPTKTVVDPDKKVKFNGYVSPEHADRARDALYVLPGEWTTGRFLEHAIDLALADLAETYNGGKPFAKRPAGQGLRRGPRIT
ncbi:hypothetical protein ACFQ46_10675 [Kineococcus sp. GCM10028916]|uniref:hypothetical protein n=1 Tax=Kineococcus sp. GCM10028916 TaxID=3273394 RepID=UPI00362E75F2